MPLWTEETAQWLKAHIAPAADLGSSPITTTRPLTTA